MDTVQAFAMGESSRGKEPKVFDWDKAAQIIKDRGAQSASAGLAQDWEWTAGLILKDGNPIPADDTYTYLASTWATPTLRINGENIECYKMKSETPGWGSDTYWPQSALDIFNA